jgi:uncharacterized Fe-S center protein
MSVSRVYFIPIDSIASTKKISAAGARLLERVLEDGELKLPRKVPLKVHFGESGNVTYIPSEDFKGIIDYLERNGHEPFYTETNALYSGSRMRAEDHMRLAREHGFTHAPVVIADGDRGDDFVEVEVNLKRFRKCKIGAGIARHKSVLIIAHFKGHMLAGFGGALKQLSMGCASRGGKLAMHHSSKPYVNWVSCNQCGTCAEQCPVDAITVGRVTKIDKNVCIGCAACVAVCPERAIKLNFLRASLAKPFYEKLMEGAFAAQKGKRNVYLNFALNITRGCDCMGHRMKPVVPDIGVLASTDPVAIDQASLDLVQKAGGRKRFGGRYQLEYAERIGLGTREYELVEM